MISVVETAATILLIILMILLVSHLINGTALEWLSSKFKVAGT